MTVMVEWIVSASVLMVIILGLRFILKGKISLRLQYGLWILVLLRLLIPVSFGSSPVSTATVVETVLPPQAVITQQVPAFTPPVTQMLPSENISESTVGGVDHSSVTVHKAASAASVLKMVWICGGSGLGIAIILSNLLFLQKQKKNRTLFRVENHIPVYISPSLDTPCLVGFFRPAVYIPEKVAEDPTLFRHAFVHEMTHYRHGDHLWSVLRAAALCIHWYNPLVWLCAILSKQDAELACDEGTIRILGEEQRSAYGKTLISLTCEKKNSPLLTATTMTGSKSAIKERISLIVKKPKTAIFTLVSLIFICALVVGCTFTGAKKDETPESTTEPVEIPAVPVTPEIIAPEGETLPSIPPYIPVDDMTPIKAIYKVFIPDEYYHTVLVQNDIMSEATAINTTPDFLIDIVKQYEWEPMEVPDSTTSETTVSFGPTYRAYCVRFYESGLMEYNYADDDVRFWKLKDDTQAENLFTNVRMEFDLAQLRQFPALVCSGQNSPEEIARQYFEVALQEKLRHLSPGSFFEISDFKLVDLEITEVSPSHTAMTGWVEFAVKPVKSDYFPYFGSKRPGTGELEGMTIVHLAFTLGLTPGGYWLTCSIYSTGECTLPPEIEEGITPEYAVEKVFGMTSDNIHEVRFLYKENASYGFQCNDISDRLISVIKDYSWTKLEDAAYPVQEKCVFFTGSGWENTELRFTESGLIGLWFGNDYVVWQISDPGKADEFFTMIRMHAESAALTIDFLRIPGNTPEEAVENFVKDSYRDLRIAQPSGTSLAITKYQVVDWQIEAVSEDKTAVVGLFRYATAPEDWNNQLLWAGNTREGTGEYEGMVIDTREFLLQLQEDGTWHCTGFGTGGYTLP